KVGFMISVAAVGEATKALHEMKEGDKLGFRGPYGTSFALPESGSIALVAGGYGMVPLSYLAQEARKNGIEVHLFIGARNKDELLFRNWMEEISVQLHIATDDGSEGFKGYNTDLCEKELESVKPDKVYTVGPEGMEVKVSYICNGHNIPFEISLERYMKCGFGICGQCCVDPTGWRMCVEGPVLNQDQISQVEEFGKYHRTPSGKKINH
ncbi:MAG TPA: dihydroorotate dehydrogenase electron transfer subunit, partial [Candidatus Woesebacteria bacterium]|nr:dihydroorotate dehydrogenase electron transfer subunit [Candidatus Woesebacteria bacterium]